MLYLPILSWSLGHLKDPLIAHLLGSIMYYTISAYSPYWVAFDLTYPSPDPRKIESPLRCFRHRQEQSINARARNAIAILRSFTPDIAYQRCPTNQSGACRLGSARPGNQRSSATTPKEIGIMATLRSCHFTPFTLLPQEPY